MKPNIGLHSKLHPKIWAELDLQADVKAAIMKIVDAFLEYVGIDNIPDDIIFTGSMANYNYTDVSDIDIHLIYDFTNFRTRPEVAQRFLDAKKTLWNKNHDIKIRGHEVELYVQDASEPHVANGMYSITNGQWIQKPEKQVGKVSIDYKNIHEKARFYTNKIEAHKEDHKKLEEIKEKIRQMRVHGLHTGGEYSEGNLIFKVLRNSGVLKKLVGYIQKGFDQSLSLKQEKMK